MRVLVLYDHVSESARADEADALVQARAVCAALESLGHEWMTLGLTLDLDAARSALEQLQPDLIFNLVESLGGFGRMIHVPLYLLDALRIPYTGAPADAMLQTSNKLLAKRMMQSAGIPTPAWFSLDDSHSPDFGTMRDANGLKSEGARFIVKSVWEHASVGLDDDAVFTPSSIDEIHDAIESRRDRLGGDAFAEQFIDGREFNLALLAADAPNLGNTGVSPVRNPEILPPAEIVFENFAADQLKIVGYRAKWDEQSFEYRHTPRNYDFPPADESLLNHMRSIALQCWKLFNLRGYARVDFRVDHTGQPWVLEVNANPCLSPDAGFAAALDRAAIPFTAAVDRIVRDVRSASNILCP